MESAIKSTIYIRKRDIVKDTLRDFGFATGDFPWPSDVEVKDPGTVECEGEHGQRVFFPDMPSFKAYDLEIEFKRRPSAEPYAEAYAKFRDFLTGLDGRGTELAIYSPYHGVGRGKIWTQSISPLKYGRDSEGEYANVKVKFMVTDPVTDVTINI